MSVDEGGPHERPLNGARATALYESARFPDPGVAPEAPTPEGDDDATLRILGVPAPPEIAGPVLAALGLLLAVLGWRWRRRRRRR